MTDMYYSPNGYSYPYLNPYPYYSNNQIYNYGSQPQYWSNTDETEFAQRYSNLQRIHEDRRIKLKDYGKKPFVVNIEEVTKQNNTFRTAFWTGNHFQVTLMSINVGEDIGLEVHPHTDQFLRLEDGEGIVVMGNTKDNLYFKRRVSDNFAIMVPAGTWHNVINTGNKPIKLYSIYAPVQHPFGTVHKTKADAMAAEKNRRNNYSVLW